MTGDRVLAANLAPGDVIHVEHTHDTPCSPCLCGHWQTDVVVTGPPRRVGAHYVVDWQETPALLGGTTDITGANTYDLDGEAIRIGHMGRAA